MEAFPRGLPLSKPGAAGRRWAASLGGQRPFAFCGGSAVSRTDITTLGGTREDCFLRQGSPSGVRTQALAVSPIGIAQVRLLVHSGVSK